LNVKYRVYLGWVGNYRPTEPNPTYIENHELLRYLSKNNLSLSEFQELKEFGFSNKNANNPRNSIQPLLPLPHQERYPQPLIDMEIEEDQGRPTYYRHQPEERVQEDQGRPNYYRHQREERVQEVQGRPNNNRHHPGERDQEVQGRPAYNRQQPEERDQDDQGRPNYYRPQPEVRDPGPSRTVVTATRLVKSIFDLDSADDPRVCHLLQSQEEVDIALKITSILSKAMAQRFENKLQNRRGQDSRDGSETRSSRIHDVDQRHSSRSERHGSFERGFEKNPLGDRPYNDARPDKRPYFEEGGRPSSDHLQRAGPSPPKDYRPRSPRNASDQYTLLLSARYPSPTPRRDQEEVKRPRIDYTPSYDERERRQDMRNGEDYLRQQVIINL